MRLLVFAPAVGLMWAALAGTAVRAQQQIQIPQPKFDTRLYRLPIDSEATLWTNDAGTAPTGHFRAKLGFHHMTNPLVFNYNDEYKVDVLSSVSEAQVVGGVNVAFLRFGLDVPVLLRVDGSQIEPSGGLGDIALDVKAVALDREGSDAPVGLAGLLRVTVPTGTVDAAVGTEGVGVEVEGILDKRVGPVLVAGNLGHRFLPKADLGTLEWGSYGYGRLGAGWFIVEEAGISVDLAAHLVYGIDFAEPVGHPVEGIVGGFGRLNEYFVLRGGVGTGMSGGVGAPDLRFVGSFGYEPVEVRDRDEDGIVDKVDVCPLQPEDLDGFADDDGCPDPTQKVVLKIRNHLGELLTGGTMTLQTEDGIKEGGSELSLQMHAGSYEVTGYAERYADTTSRFTVVEGRDTVVEVDLEPLFGEVRAVVRDSGGRYLNGVLEVDGERPARVMSGIGRTDAMAGQRAVVVRSEGFQTASQSAKVTVGQRTTLEFVLTPAKAKITAEKIEILEKVFFDVGKATIKPESFALLDQVAEILVEHPDVTKVRVEGHTDARGSANANRRLSTTRAESVRDYLVSKGVAVERLDAVGYGPDRPLDPSRTTAAYDLNRRVEFVIVERVPSR